MRWEKISSDGATGNQNLYRSGEPNDEAKMGIRCLKFQPESEGWEATESGDLLPVE